MKLKTFSLFLGLLCSTAMWAQNPKVELSHMKTVVMGDSVVLTMEVKVNMDEMPSKNQLRLLPVLNLDGKSVAVEPIIVLNGKKQHSLYKRKMLLEERKAGTDFKNKEKAYEYKGGIFAMEYRGAVAWNKSFRSANVQVNQQMMDANGAVVQERMFNLQPNDNSLRADKGKSSTLLPGASVLGEGANDIVDLEQDFSVIYKGSYLEPASDAVYERNQKELRFSLEEAKIIAEINPNMLSLRELYSVAKSYEDRPAMFHKIIKISVELYPSNPIANLNAAASAIELKDADAAAGFLQAAPHDSLAYTNCKGAYELMRNNIQEGLRLLKAASAAGSQEADENLKIFFSSFKEE